MEEQIEKMVSAINEEAGYEYATADDITTTRDSVDDFKKHQEFFALRKTSLGDLHVFLKGSREIVVMDCGEHRLVMID
jgi:hypothetical protein